MKRLLLFLLFFSSLLPAFAKHVTGGEVIYTCTGQAPGVSKTYRITLLLFRDNNTIGGAALPGTVTMRIFNNDANSLFGGDRDINQTSAETVPVLDPPNCLTNEPNLDYTVGYYSFSVTLPDNAKGYTVTFQTCCRIDGIANTGVSVGATYIGEIPGSTTLLTEIDNSPRFQTGISIICFKKNFILDFSATDPDPDDSLVYSMVEAYGGGAATNAAFADPAPPPYASIPYVAPFTDLFPLGPLGHINTATGIISGIAPDAGRYVVCVAVKTYRHGRYIGTHRKDFIITVAECDFASAVLQEVYRKCDNFTVDFVNLNTSLLNLTFDWDFGDGQTSQLEAPSHTYASAGDYIVKLVVNRGTLCSDSMTSIVKVYPGFNPAFAPVPPMCKDLPVQFTDATTAAFGVPSIWSWNFGDPVTAADTSHLQNPAYIYHAAGTYNVEFIVETSVGCRDTLYPEVTIVDRPDFHLPNDTLICIIDTLQLNAITSAIGGSITWSPNYMISDIHSFTPNVSPDVTTTYTALFVDASGCNVSESITVNVTPGVSLTAANDTTICRTDSLTLNLPNTNGIYFAWTANPATTISDPGIRNPVAFPTAPLTTFHIKSSISAKCFNEDDIVVKTVPYPVPVVSGNDPICFGKNAQLQASGGSSYTWSPAAYLTNPNIANPVSVAPKATVFYNVTVTDTLGCPKPATAAFTVHVIKIIANAGPQDTSIVLDQPLQLHATGSTLYEWTPATWLDNPSIADPVSNPRNNITYTVKVSNSIGCFALDTINVKVYFVPPDVYVPSAFTPGSDAVNDLFRPVALGIRSLDYFRVFNRWGELVYSTDKIYEGWNGIFKGTAQPPATYVWEISAVDYKNVRIRRKGSVILIR